MTPSKACYTFNPLSKNYASPVVADLSGEDYTYTLDSGSGCADVAVTVNAAAQGTYGIQSGSQAHPIYPGVFDGAVSVVSTNAADILVSERQIYGNSFSESMGIPGNRLTTEYWFPWYDGLTMNTWITIGAPGSNVGNATVEVYIGSGGTPIGTYSVAPGSQVHPDYPGVFDGAVRVVSTDGKDIFASERQIYGGSFSETMGIPANRLDTEYWFPLYELRRR